MSSTPHPPITERTILHSYLLPPSPLPTILPYSTFLNLVPATYKNDPDYASSIKRLYRDLQFQRSITVDQVRENIERECGVKAVGLKTRLARRIAIEEGEVKEEDEIDAEPRRKRRRANRSKRAGERAMGADDGGEDAEAEPMTTTMIKEEDEDSMISSEDEFTDPRYLAVHQVMYGHPSNLHPAANVLNVSGDLTTSWHKFSSGSAFHTRDSLLQAMEDASGSLDKTLEELEAECIKMRASIGETVGALSDLRYGKRQSDGDGSGKEYKDVLDDLEQFQEVLRSRSQE